VTKDGVRRYLNKTVTVRLAPDDELGAVTITGLLTRDVLSRQFTIVGRRDARPDETRNFTFWPADVASIDERR